MSRMASGLVRLSRSLLPRTSRFQASKRAPRNSSSSSFKDWIIVPMAPSSTRTRSRASARSQDSVCETVVRSGIAANSVLLLPLPGGERVGVRGARSLRQSRKDLLEHPIHVLQHVVVPDAQHEIAARFEDCRALGISFRIRRVLTAIKLDDETSIRTAEIREEPVDGHLALELPSVQSSITQAKPQLAFRIRLIAAQVARSFDSLAHSAPHPPALCA